MVFIIHFIIGREQTSAVFALAAIVNRCGDASFRLGPGLVRALLQDFQLHAVANEAGQLRLIDAGSGQAERERLDRTKPTFSGLQLSRILSTKLCQQCSYVVLRLQATRTAPPHRRGARCPARSGPLCLGGDSPSSPCPKPALRQACTRRESSADGPRRAAILEL